MTTLREADPGVGGTHKPDPGRTVLLGYPVLAAVEDPNREVPPRYPKIPGVGRNGSLSGGSDRSPSGSSTGSRSPGTTPD